MGLIHQIDPKTKKPIRKNILFVKNGAIIVVCNQINIQISFLVLKREEYVGSLKGYKVEGYLAASLHSEELILSHDEASVQLSG